jgi:hypothetical protein
VEGYPVIRSAVRPIAIAHAAQPNSTSQLGEVHRVVARFFPPIRTIPLADMGTQPGSSKLRRASETGGSAMRRLIRSILAIVQS